MDEFTSSQNSPDYGILGFCVDERREKAVIIRNWTQDDISIRPMRNKQDEYSHNTTNGINEPSTDRTTVYESSKLSEIIPSSLVISLHWF